MCNGWRVWKSWPFLVNQPLTCAVEVIGVVLMITGVHWCGQRLTRYIFDVSQKTWLSFESKINLVLA